MNNYEKVKKELGIHAHALEIPSGAAEIFVERSLKAAEKKLRDKKLITEKDLERAVYAELKKYHADLAYVYKNRGKII